MILRARAHEFAREEADGEREKTSYLSLSFFHPLLPASAACLPVVRPTVRLLFSSLLPFIRVEWLMGSRRHRGISLFTPHRTPPFDPFEVPVSFPLVRIGEFSAFLRTRLSLPRSLSIVIARQWYTPFLCPRCYCINIAAPWNGAINRTESLAEDWSGQFVTKVSKHKI